MAFSGRVDTTTEDFLVPRVIDTVLRENTFATDILSKTKTLKSATQLFPIKYQKGISGTSFSGFDTLPTSASDTRVSLTANPRFYAMNVALPVTEIAANATENQVLDLVDIEMKSRAQDMADEIGSQFYGVGTGNGGKDFVGLEGIVDDGTNLATYFGLSRTTYTTLNATVTSAGGAVTLAKMSTMYNAITDGQVAPTDIYTTPAVFSFYEALLLPLQQNINTLGNKTPTRAGTGYTTLDYKGLPVKKDRKCTSGVMYFINRDYLDFHALPMTNIGDFKPVKISSKDIEGNVYSSVPGLGFAWSGWVKPTDALAWNGWITLAGNLISDNPRRNGKLTAITS